jgi:hypothetical protein
MTDLEDVLGTATPIGGPRFTCVGAEADRYAAGPTVLLHIEVTEESGIPVHAIGLRAQVRILPQRRRYDDVEAEALTDLFGARTSWARSLKPLQLAFLSAMVPSFTGATDVALHLPCSYDVDVAAHKYLAALEDGVVPLLILFSGTWFTERDGRLQVLPIPWDREATFGLPVAAWRDAMDQHFPGAAWLRVGHDTFDALSRFRSAHGLLGWDDAIGRLLAGAEEAGP